MEASENGMKSIRFKTDQEEANTRSRAAEEEKLHHTYEEVAHSLAVISTLQHPHAITCSHQ